MQKQKIKTEKTATEMFRVFDPSQMAHNVTCTINILIVPNHIHVTNGIISHCITH